MASQLERRRGKRRNWKKRAEELEGCLETWMETMWIQLQLPNQQHDNSETLVGGFVGQNGSLSDLKHLEGTKISFEDERSDWSPYELHLAQLFCSMASQLERQRGKRRNWKKRAEDLEGCLETWMETMWIQLQLPNQQHDDSETLVGGSLSSDGMKTNEKKEPRKEEKEKNKKERAAKEKKERKEEKKREAKDKKERKEHERKLKKEKKEREEKEKKERKEHEKKRKEAKEGV
ncbi:uncharacterized protein LOC144031032 [Festucalex cinctus]